MADYFVVLLLDSCEKGDGVFVAVGTDRVETVGEESGFRLLDVQWRDGGEEGGVGGRGFGEEALVLDSALYVASQLFPRLLLLRPYLKLSPRGRNFLKRLHRDSNAIQLPYQLLLILQLQPFRYGLHLIQ